ncbi:MAG TPA: hypothetical protein VH592_19100 [Gemmataceae bacterium]|jgi:hypothetical protein
MKTSQFSRLLALLERLDQMKIPYSMRHSRIDAVMIVVFAPGEYWEIELLEDGEIVIERFRSNGQIDDESVLEELFALWSEDDVSPAPIGNQDDSSTGK